jgi:hypothetical protein
LLFLFLFYPSPPLLLLLLLLLSLFSAFSPPFLKAKVSVQVLEKRKNPEVLHCCARRRKRRRGGAGRGEVGKGKKPEEWEENVQSFEERTSQT